MLVEDLEPAAHELVVVRFVAGGAAQFFDARLLGHRNPNLGSQHSLHVQGYNRLFHLEELFKMCRRCPAFGFCDLRAAMHGWGGAREPGVTVRWSAHYVIVHH